MTNDRFKLSPVSIVPYCRYFVVDSSLGPPALICVAVHLALDSTFAYYTIYKF